MLNWSAWAGWLVRLPYRVMVASGWWALMVLMSESGNPASVIPNPTDRLWWVLRAGLVSAMLFRPPLVWWEFGAERDDRALPAR